MFYDNRYIGDKEYNNIEILHLFWQATTVPFLFQETDPKETPMMSRGP